MASPPVSLGEGGGVGVYISTWAVLCHSTDSTVATSLSLALATHRLPELLPSDPAVPATCCPGMLTGQFSVDTSQFGLLDP